MVGQQFGDVAYASCQSFQRLGVDLECAVRPLQAAIGQRAVNLAALDLLRKPLSQLGFCLAELIGQTEARLEEAVVDAANFTDESSPRPRYLAACEPGHAG